MSLSDSEDASGAFRATAEEEEEEVLSSAVEVGVAPEALGTEDEASLDDDGGVVYSKLETEAAEDVVEPAEDRENPAHGGDETEEDHASQSMTISASTPNENAWNAEVDGHHEEVDEVDDLASAKEARVSLDALDPENMLDDSAASELITPSAELSAIKGASDSADQATLQTSPSAVVTERLALYEEESKDDRDELHRDDQDGEEPLCVRLDENAAVDVPNDGKPIYLDDRHNSIIQRRDKGPFEFISLRGGNNLVIDAPFEGFAQDIKVSACKCFAVTWSQSEKDQRVFVLPIQPPDGQKVAPIVLHRKHGGLLLCAVWMDPYLGHALELRQNKPQLAVLCLVTMGMGIETFEVRWTADGSLIAQSTCEDEFDVLYCSTLPHRNVLCVNGKASRNNESKLIPLHVSAGSTKTERWPPVTILTDPKAPTSGTLAELYGRIYFVQIFPQKLLVHPIGPEKSKEIKSLRTVQGRVLLSIVDSLLVVHSARTNVSLVFDIKLQSDQPVCHPRPLKHGEAYGDYWQFFPPNWLFDKKLSRACPLKLDLQAMADFFNPDDGLMAPRLASFLLRREDEETALRVLTQHVLRDLLPTWNGQGPLVEEAVIWMRVLAECVQGDGPRREFPVKRFVGGVLTPLIQENAYMGALAGLEYCSALAKVSKSFAQDVCMIMSKIGVALGPRIYDQFRLIGMVDNHVKQTADPENTERRVGEMLDKGAFSSAVRLCVLAKWTGGRGVLQRLMRACNGRVDRACLLYDALRRPDAESQREDLREILLSDGQCLPRDALQAFSRLAGNRETDGVITGDQA